MNHKKDFIDTIAQILSVREMGSELENIFSVFVNICSTFGSMQMLPKKKFSQDKKKNE